MKQDKDFLFDEDQTKYFGKIIADKYHTKFVDIGKSDKCDLYMEEYEYHCVYEFFTNEYFKYNSISSMLMCSEDKKDENNRCYVSIIKNKICNFHVLIMPPYSIEFETFYDVNDIAKHMIFLKNIDFFNTIESDWISR